MDISEIRAIRHKGSRLFALRKNIEKTPSFVQEPQLFELDELLQYVQIERERLNVLAVSTTPALSEHNLPDLGRLNWLEKIVLAEKERRRQNEERGMVEPGTSGLALEKLDRLERLIQTVIEKDETAAQSEGDEIPKPPTVDLPPKIRQEFRELFLNPAKDIPAILEALKCCRFIDENYQLRKEFPRYAIAGVVEALWPPNTEFFVEGNWSKNIKGFCLQLGVPVEPRIEKGKGKRERFRKQFTACFAALVQNENQ